jgi:hypothetical protein
MYIEIAFSIPVSILAMHAIIEGLPATAVAKVFNPKYAYITTCHCCWQR